MVRVFCLGVVLMAGGGGFAAPALPPVPPALVTPRELVDRGYAASPLRVEGRLNLTRGNGEKQAITLAMPVWARRGTVVVPADQLRALMALCEETERHAHRCRALEAETRALQRRWTALLNHPGHRSWTTSDEP